ncbi:MAG: tRNA (N6-threonylcarbamoyladenosine(37)-N6)-methyltransferase TrmO [Gammaproteobacteria bacterium]|nr:tRNA (N6-threonylcarbamoyladenosine(37)-N6)-methyltransferase TrmO [Gammaproteobacteria bacterium]
MGYTVTPIGYVRSCFKEKFAIPRQPLLAPAAQGCIELLPPYDQADAIAGLEEISHIWVIFLFHKTLDKVPRLKVRPPRLGGNKSIGVFASRATHRPNGIGQSAVRLERAEPGRLWISGIDLLDGTPVLDIKPYVPYADHLPMAHNAIADHAPTLITVNWQPSALQQAEQHAQRLQQPLSALIEQCLAQDPRPAYQQPTPERIYGVQFYDVQVRWHYLTLEQIEVIEVCLA